MRSLPCKAMNRGPGWPDAGAPSSAAMRISLGPVQVDALTFSQALQAIEGLVGCGGSVFTPNVDHVVLADEDAEFRAAYSASSLCLADGMPLVWASRLLGRALPGEVFGSGLLVPVLGLGAAP